MSRQIRQYICDRLTAVADSLSVLAFETFNDGIARNALVACANAADHLCLALMTKAMRDEKAKCYDCAPLPDEGLD